MYPIHPIVHGHLGIARSVRVAPIESVRLGMADDIVVILQKMEAWALSAEGMKHPMLVAQKPMRSLAEMSQSPMEGVAHYGGNHGPTERAAKGTVRPFENASL